MPVVLLPCGDGVAFLSYVGAADQHTGAFPFRVLVPTRQSLYTTRHALDVITHCIASHRSLLRVAICDLPAKGCLASLMRCSGRRAALSMLAFR